MCRSSARVLGRVGVGGEASVEFEMCSEVAFARGAAIARARVGAAIY